MAKAINKEAEYKALYKVYSKMTHATAWAILGTCSWDDMALLLSLKSNGGLLQAACKQDWPSCQCTDAKGLKRGIELVCIARASRNAFKNS